MQRWWVCTARQKLLLWPEEKEEKQGVVHICGHGALVVRDGWTVWNEVIVCKRKIICYTCACRVWVHGEGASELSECNSPARYSWLMPLPAEYQGFWQIPHESLLSLSTVKWSVLPLPSLQSLKSMGHFQ